jgi:hypothetical protein
MNKQSRPEPKIILSAGEVSTYVVCPEAWRLERELGSSGNRQDTKRALQGKQLHANWAENVNEARHLLYGVRLILYLVILAILTLVYVIRS